MTFWDYLTLLTVMIIVGIMFIAWIGIKYDIVGRDERNKELQLEIIKMQEKEIRRKQRKRKKAKGGNLWMVKY